VSFPRSVLQPVAVCPAAAGRASATSTCRPRTAVTVPTAVSLLAQQTLGLLKPLFSGGRDETLTDAASGVRSRGKRRGPRMGRSALP
jgi:hypothetical protein